MHAHIQLPQVRAGTRKRGRETREEEGHSQAEVVEAVGRSLLLEGREKQPVEEDHTLRSLRWPLLALVAPVLATWRRRR